MGLQLVTPPASEPLTLTEAKEHLRIETTAEDTFITGLIQAAREWCEEYQNRAYITQTWDLSLDKFPGSLFRLPKPPLQSIASFKYYDKGGTEHVFDAADYEVDISSFMGRISLAYGKSWPSVTLRPMNGVVIQFVAGYGAAGSDVPERIRIAIKQLLGHLYENREATNIKELSEVPFAIYTLLGLDRVWPV
jgi:uncharacterized phiE125 gp8 family phage protein